MGTAYDELGGPPVDLYVDGVAWPADQVGEITITYGRQSAEDRVEAATLTVELLTPDPATRPAVGSSVAVELNELAHWFYDTPTGARRFTGTCTSAALRMQRQRPDQPLEAVTRVTAAGPKAQLARIVIGDEPWPSERVEDRVARIVNLAHDWQVAYGVQAPIVVGTIEPHYVPPLGEHPWAVVARDVDRQPALGLVDEIAEDSGGELVELRDGTLTWQGLDHRRPTAPLLELAADDVLADAEWTQELDGLVNLLRVPMPPIYGYTLTAYDPESAAIHGPIDMTRTTNLEPLDEGTLSRTFPGDLFSYLTHVGLARQSRPRWVIPALVMAIDPERLNLGTPEDPGLTIGQAKELLALEVGDLITLTGLSAQAPLNHDRLWVEGWTETISRRGWTVALNVTEFGHTGPAVRWIDIPPSGPAATWADLGDLQWIETGAWFPPLADAGRWLDETPDTAWEDLGATTWQETS